MCSLPRVQGKRAASPALNEPNKKRRVEPDSVASSDSTSKISLDAFGIPRTEGRSLTAADLRSALDLLAPTTTPSQAVLPPSEILSKTPAISGTGSATDPVVISEEPSITAVPATSTHGRSSAPRRPSRSQQAYAFLEALPTDPTDVLSQTLRTILKTPTTVSHKGGSVSRDTVVFLVNGRQTGTPFIRLLRHLASPIKRKDKKAGLELLKKLVEAMRATEEASKATSAGRSSTSSTPMPITPGTPCANSFNIPDSSGNPYSFEPTYESALFPQPEYSFQSSSSFPLQPLGGPDKLLPTDIAIDPELLAVSQDPGYLQSAPLDLQGFDIDLIELFGALPTPISDSAAPTSHLDSIITPGIDATPDSALRVEHTLAANTSTWDDLTNIQLDTLFESWLPPQPVQSAPVAAAAPSMMVDPHIANIFPQPTPHPNLQAIPQPGPSNSSMRASKQPDVPPGGMRIPNRAEALALLERARARKKELEAKLSQARRQVWACRIEAGVEKNLVERLGKK
ncbi:hypothetical protein BDV93DRAFT_544206 [Ceratobasidium sp. AG-I]|nr:hypothetical protein BDV93DRAFT_544206 [Ceratobasidium sp. AG-I]